MSLIRIKGGTAIPPQQALLSGYSPDSHAQRMPVGNLINKIKLSTNKGSKMFKKLFVALFLILTVPFIAQTFSYSGPTSVTIPFGSTQKTVTYNFTYSGTSNLIRPKLIVVLDGNFITPDLCTGNLPNLPSSVNLTFSPGQHSLKISLLSVDPSYMSCYYPLIHKVVDLTVAVSQQIQIQNKFNNSSENGEIYVNGVSTAAPANLTVTVGSTLNVEAKTQDINNIRRDWNTSAIERSNWKNVINGVTYPLSYDKHLVLTLSSSQIPSIFEAYYTDKYKVSTNAATEFDGISSGVAENFIFDSNTGNLTPPTTITAGGNGYNFAYWNDDNIYPQTRPFTPTQNTSKEAFYKAQTKSDNSVALDGSVQKKLVQIANGKRYSVYESDDKVWLEKSTDGGSWTVANQGRPISVLREQYSTGLHFYEESQNPSLFRYNNFLFIVNEVLTGGTPTLNFYVYNTSTESVVYNGLTTAETNPDYFPRIFNEYDMHPVLFCTNTNRAETMQRIFIVWHQDYYPDEINPGLFYIMGDYNTLDNSIVWKSFDQTNNHIDNTDGNSKYPTVAGLLDQNYFDGPLYHIAWQQGTSAIKYCQLTNTSWNSSVLSDQEYSEPSSPCGNSHNIFPSIVVNEIDGYPRLTWVGKNLVPPLDVQKMFLRGRISSGWNPNYYSFGSDVVYQDMAYTLNDDAYVIGFSQGVNGKKYITNASWTIKSFSGIYGTGIQLTDFGITRASVQAAAVNGSSSPYLIDFSTFSVTKEETVLPDKIRELVVSNDDMHLKYYFGNISVDGDTVGFGEFEKPEMINDLELAEQFMLTEEFDVDDDTEFLVTVGSALNITNALPDADYISFSLELIDVATDEVLGAYYPYEVNHSSQNGMSEQNYQISTQGIGNKTVKLRVNTSTNLESEYFVSTVIDFEGRANKSNYVEIDYTGELEVTSYDIAQNYPNPFNPVTTIKYQIPQSGNVTLKIFDVLGREIKTLVSEYKEKGAYTAEFNGSYLASGVYLYSISVNDYSATKKMMLLK